MKFVAVYILFSSSILCGSIYGSIFTLLMVPFLKPCHSICHVLHDFGYF